MESELQGARSYRRGYLSLEHPQILRELIATSSRGSEYSEVRLLVR